MAPNVDNSHEDFVPLLVWHAASVVKLKRNTWKLTAMATVPVLSVKRLKARMYSYPDTFETNESI